MNAETLIQFFSPLLTNLGLVRDAIALLQLFGIPVTTIAKVILYSVLFVWGFWGLYALVMNLYRAKLANKLTRFQTYLGMPYYVIGLAVDFIAQYTLACIIFYGLPRKGERLVTTRLIRLRREEPNSTRGKLATYICEQGLDSLDPTGDHC
jgi:hypothetical protein